MTGRESFTPEEWRTLARTPVEVMFGVVMSSYGGLRRELGAIRRTLRHTEEFPSETELVAQLSGFLGVNAAKLRREAESGDLDSRLTKARAYDSCRASASILVDRTSEAERREYGRFVLWCAERVAQAGVEGGVLRIGGRRLSPAERRFLDSVAEALGVARSSDEANG
jgi:hypothetical protein